MAKSGITLMIAVLLSGSSIGATELSDEMTGNEVAALAYERDDGAQVAQTLIMELIDKRGNIRSRTTKLFRKEYEEVHKTVIVINDPPELEGTGFLTFDYLDSVRSDDQWLYLPAMRRERRVSSSDRGSYFLGTDFTYEDIKERTRISVADFDFRIIERIVAKSGEELYKVEATPRSKKIAQELGYGKIEATIDASNWMYRELLYSDVALNPLKTIELTDVAIIDGVLTAQTIICKNLKTSHSTVFRFEDIDYASPIDDQIFSVSALRRGLF